MTCSLSNLNIYLKGNGSTMAQADLFSIDKYTIAIDGIDNLMKFARFNPKNSKILLGPLELAEDLQTKTGTILFKKKSLISHDRVARLKNICELHELELSFKIKRSSQLIKELRKIIADRMAKLLKKNQRTKVFRKILSGISDNFNTYMNEILTDDNITLAIYHMWSVCESSKRSSLSFINHSINTVLFSLAIALSKQYTNSVGMDRAKSLEIIKASLFLNYGALTHIDNILENPADIRFKVFWNANRKGCSYLGNLQLDFNILDAIRLVCEYYHGRKDFIQKNEWPDTVANIILVAEAFLQKVNGLFGDLTPVKQTVDGLNVRAFEKDLNDKPVAALTLALNQQDIFDFYRELDSLIKVCPYESAYPYPLIGYRSPSIFICINTVLECIELEQNIKAVYLVRQFGELQPGEYHRCSLLTPKLLAFYDEHYGEIKEAAIEQTDIQGKGQPSKNGEKLPS